MKPRTLEEAAYRKRQWEEQFEGLDKQGIFRAGYVRGHAEGRRNVIKLLRKVAAVLRSSEAPPE